MVCSRCGGNLPEGSLFCPKCGRTVNQASSSEPSPPGALRCRRCGSPLPEVCQFCPKCGEDVSAFAQPVAVESLFPQPRGKVRLAAWFLLPALLLSLALLALTDNPVSQQFERIFHRTHTENIGPEVFSVGSGSFSYFKFDVPSAATDVSVGGQFNVQAGGDGNIDVQLLTDAGFISWQDGYSANSYYGSGQVPRGTINALLPATAGTYYLVFNNKFSPKDQKLPPKAHKLAPKDRRFSLNDQETIQSDVILTYRRWWPIF